MRNKALNTSGLIGMRDHRNETRQRTNIGHPGGIPGNITVTGKVGQLVDVIAASISSTSAL